MTPDQTPEYPYLLLNADDWEAVKDRVDAGGGDMGEYAYQHNNTPHTYPVLAQFSCWDDPDDPATAGCLLALLGLGSGAWVATTVLDDGTHIVRCSPRGKVGARFEGCGATLGRACIAAAAALGRWPGGGE